MIAGNLKKCPYCSEDINAEAQKCKHCKSELVKKKRSKLVRFFVALSQIIIVLYAIYLIIGGDRMMKEGDELIKSGKEMMGLAHY